MTRASFLRPLLVLFTLLALTAATACDGPKAVDSCGDAFIDPGEDCDGALLNGATCTSIGYYNAAGVLGCTAGCAFDVSDCGGHCGDNIIEDDHGEECEGTNLQGASCASLNFSRGGALACGADCRYDTSLCLSTCGNGNLEPDEPCDDANTAPGDGCAADCTVEPGWTCTGTTVSVCTSSCPEGLTWCDGDCADLFNDPDRCGACDHACDAGQRCLAGVCRAPGTPWGPAGYFGGSPTTCLGEAVNFDLGACDGRIVIFLSTRVRATPEDPWVPEFRLHVLDENLGQWATQPQLPVALPQDYELAPGMAVTCRGEQLTAAYAYNLPLNPSPGVNVSVLDPMATEWRPLGGTTLTTSCWAHPWMDIGFDGEGNLHVLDMCHWYSSGQMVEYAWFDGEQWNIAPSVDGTPRVVSRPNSGHPALAFIQGRALLGLSPRNPETTITEHRVQRWDGDAWTSSEALSSYVTPDISSYATDIWHEDLSIDGNGVATCAAWSHDRDQNSTDGIIDPYIYVSCADDFQGVWAPAGDEALVTVDHQGRAPSVAVVGRYVYLAYLTPESDELVGPESYWHIRVMRRPIADASAWEIIGDSIYGYYYPQNMKPPQLLLAGTKLVLGYVENADNSEWVSYIHVMSP